MRKPVGAAAIEKRSLDRIIRIDRISRKRVRKRGLNGRPAKLNAIGALSCGTEEMWREHENWFEACRGHEVPAEDFRRLSSFPPALLPHVNAEARCACRDRDAQTRSDHDRGVDFGMEEEGGGPSPEGGHPLRPRNGESGLRGRIAGGRLPGEDPREGAGDRPRGHSGRISAQTRRGRRRNGGCTRRCGGGSARSGLRCPAGRRTREGHAAGEESGAGIRDRPCRRGRHGPRR